MTNRAVLYCRSSKDRSDISIDAQRRALQELASTRGLVVVQEFADAVESGKDDDRPAFQQLLHSLKAQDRGWEYILVLDTSRVARRRHLAMIFEHECERAGVQIVYKALPDTDPITGMLLKSILQAMDEWHSLTSRAKGLAGMAENVRQGWRAGGKAPRGYKLEYHATGVMREGAPVLKSKLTPSDEAPLVAAYLRERAQGRPRGQLLRELEISWPAASLNDLEWGALTYAGHTAWNTTNERLQDGYRGDTKRKPRADWLVTRDTHPALITDSEAEAILVQLERGRSIRTRATERPYLLTGMLLTADGQAWHGDWDHKMRAPLYRLAKGRRISARRVDGAVLDQVRADLASDEAVRHILAAMRDLATEPVDGRRVAAIERRLQGLTAKISTLVDLITEAGQDERAAYRRTIAAHESERKGLVAELEQLRQALTQAKAARQYTEADARRLLRLAMDGLEDAAVGDLKAKKAALGGLIARITLDPSAEHCQIHYRIGAAAPDTGVNLATPRGTNETPVQWSSETSIVAKRRRG